jgi:hypothetical protein
MAEVTKTPAYLWCLPPEEPQKVSPGGRAYADVRQDYLNWVCDCTCGFSFDTEGCIAHDHFHEEP